MPLPPLTGPLGYKRAAHLLHRASYGATKEQVDTFAALTAPQAVAQLFAAGLPTPELPIDPETGSEWFVSGTTDANSGELELQKYFKAWLLAQMLSSRVPASQALAYSVREKVIFLLHTILTAISSKIDSSRALYFQDQLFRQFAFDKTAGPLVNFKELTKKISVDNAMLRLLDGNLNVKGSVNENYARELLELYSIGRGLEGTLPPVTDPGDYFLFREQDVQAAAKVLSGWDFDATFANLDPDTQLPRGRVRGSTTNASGHDNSVKQFSDRFANATIQPDPLLLNNGNATEASARDEIDQLIELIYAKPETARNICRRIYRFYVYHDIPPTLDNTIIAEMAATFAANGYKLQLVLEELFQSQHFYEAASGNQDDNFGAIIKSPLDLIIGTYRLFELTVPDYVSNATAFYEHAGGLLRAMELMGHHFYEPFDVAGYDAYHQYPIYHRSWISTNYLTRRYEFIRELVSANMMPGAVRIDAASFVRTKISPAVATNARLLVIALARYFHPQHENLTFDPAMDDNAGLTAERLNYFLTAFIKSPQIDPDPEAAWAFRWGNQVDPDTTSRQLENLFNAMLQSPEYQLF